MEERVVAIVLLGWAWELRMVCRRKGKEKKGQDQFD